MVFTHVLSISLVVSVLMQTAAFGQISSTPVLAETTGPVASHASLAGPTHSRRALVSYSEADSLLAKRNFFSTRVSLQGSRLNPGSIIQLMGDADLSQAQTLFNQGQLLRPIGPLVAASGIVIGYLAVKGTPKTAYAKGIGTPANPSPPDVLVEYTSRSLPMLMGGIGLLVGGLCLIEISNGLTAKSINLYNAQVTPQRSVSSLQSIKLGITAGGNVGFEANF